MNKHIRAQILMCRVRQGGGERRGEEPGEKVEQGKTRCERYWHGKSPSERLEWMQGTRAGEEEREGSEARETTSGEAGGGERVKVGENESSCGGESRCGG